MESKDGLLFNGWTVSFRKNIHMYSHSLNLSRGREAYDVFCEDTPSDWVGIWPYELKEKVGDATFDQLIVALRSWASQSGLHYRLYTSRQDYESNGTNVQDA